MTLVDPVWRVGWKWVSVKRRFVNIDTARRGVNWFLEEV